ncbi:MAG: ABC transporter permease subunit [Candidatus Lokiarchaeota archaeon]|nr:ABC transporter permease subunit [Candidatus Lokiarchaeota archaeon]
MKKAFTVMKKDLNEIKTSFQILGTMILAPGVLTAIAIITYAAMFPFIPDPNELITILSGPYLTPSLNVMFLMIPVLIPTYLAADSFVGEKIRKTIEALLIAPISNKELLLGKILVSFVPTILITYLFSGVYIIASNLLQIICYGNIVYNFASLGFLSGIVLHTPLLAMLDIEIMVVISLKVKGIREAQQIGGLLIIPVMSFMFFPYIGLDIYNFSNIFNVYIFLLVSLLYAGLVLLFYFLALKAFRRQKIMQKI